MATAQPTSSSMESQDFVTGSGSFTGQNGSFTASAHFLAGSSPSFPLGSYDGSRSYPGVSPSQLLGPLDPNDFKFTKMTLSVENNRGPIVDTLAMLERQNELCRDYTCCGLNLTDLHALVQHFEECHIVVVEPFLPQQSFHTTTTPLPTPAPGLQTRPCYPDPNVVSVSSQQRHQRVQVQQQPQSIEYQGFDPDDMELDVDHSVCSDPSSGPSSNPDTPLSMPLSSYSSPTPSSATYSSAPSPNPSPPASTISAFDTTPVLLSRGAHHHPHYPSCYMDLSSTRSVPEDTFKPYTEYTRLLPDAALNVSLSMEHGVAPPPINGRTNQNGQNANGAVCAPTALILSRISGNTPDSESASDSACAVSPIPGGSGASTYSQNVQALSSGGFSSSPVSSSNARVSDSGSAAQTVLASMTVIRPASSLLISKPFKCPKPNCNKSYKQSTGLKYHMTRGSCNFARPHELDRLQELLASKRSQKAAATGKGDGEREITLSDAEMREVEKEADRWLRPYACGVGGCQKRYKSMNGLRYHYDHSGDHGTIGLGLLTSGQHECLQDIKPRREMPSRCNFKSVPSTPQIHSRAAPQQALPSLGSHQQPQYVPPPQRLPTYQRVLANPPRYLYHPQRQPPSRAYAPQRYPKQQVP